MIRPTDSTVTHLVQRLKNSKPWISAGKMDARAVFGAGASAHGYLCAAVVDALHEAGMGLIVTPTPDIAARIHAEMAVWHPNACLLPASDLYLPGADPLAATRLEVLDRLGQLEPIVVVSSLPAVLQHTPRQIRRLQLSKGDTVSLTDLTEQLAAMGYERLPMVEGPGQFAVRGGILDVYPSTADQPLRADFLGDEIESLRVFDPETQRSSNIVDQAVLLPAQTEESDQGARVRTTALDFLPEDCPAVLVEVNAIQAQWEEFVRSAEAQYHTIVEHEQDVVRLNPARPIRETHADPVLLQYWLRQRPRVYLDVLQRSNPWENGITPVELPSLPVDVYRGRIDLLAQALKDTDAEGTKAVIVTPQVKRLRELLGEHSVRVNSGEETSAESIVTLIKGVQSAGFRLPDLRLLVLTDAEIFGEREVHVARRRFKEAEPISSLLELKEGDLVVHINHGIGYYRGLSIIPSPDGAESEFLRIDYAGGDKIYVPTGQMDRVQKYIGSGESPPAVNRLGGKDWERTTSKAKARAREMAQELIALYAARQKATVVPAGPDTSWQQEMESAFPFEETPDQMAAIREVKSDLEKPLPMDRLVCGDVGFGKTEVAVRAAFKMVNEGKQVAVLVPTTVLAQQHWDTFRERMGAFPVNVELLSRFRSSKEQKTVAQGLRDGTVDVVVGTHRLLSKDVEFRDLGLLVVDEEQRFGVAHKERIKQLRKNVHVLTLTATPIPRTLHMSLAGIREMSLMNDPPEGRTPIRTILTEQSDSLVREAILHETDRGGQVYFVHNRVDNIASVAMALSKVIPTARIGIGHGQMPERELERVMWDFYHRKYDVLVCTTIIESGLDVPNANTIIINNADHFGLSQLYQLRGRVGRSPRQAYCYLLYRPFKNLTEEAEQRLQAIREFSQLGSGFKIAMRDLEIRGAGNLLGAEQSGTVTSVGFEYYCQLIQQAVAELKGEETEVYTLPSIDLPIPAFIPERYIEDEGLRIAFYKKLTAVRDRAGLDALQEEFEDRFGDPPGPVWNMLRLLALRLMMKEGGILGLTGNLQRIIARLTRNLSAEKRFDIQRRRRKWVVETASIEVPVTNGDPLRTAEDTVPRIVADLTGNPTARLNGFHGTRSHAGS